MLYLKICFNFYCVLIFYFLGVKSDTAPVANERQVTDQYGRLVRDPNFQNQMRAGADINSPPPETIVAEERALITELADTIDRNNLRIEQAERKFGQEPSIQEHQLQDQIEQRRLRGELNRFEESIRAEEAARGQPTEAQRAQNRRTLLRHLQALNDHQEVRLARYEAVQRATEIKQIDGVEKILDDYLNREKLARQQEPPAQSEHHQNQRVTEYNEVDKIEQELRKNLEAMKERHVRKLPINAEHENSIKEIRSQWENLNDKIDKIESRRALEKQRAPNSSKNDKSELSESGKEKSKTSQTAEKEGATGYKALENTGEQNPGTSRSQLQAHEAKGHATEGHGTSGHGSEGHGTGGHGSGGGGGKGGQGHGHGHGHGSKG